jgi:hypothetical protein
MGWPLVLRVTKGLVAGPASDRALIAGAARSIAVLRVTGG